MNHNFERHEVWEEPDSPRVREFRLSVQSLLRDSERDNHRDIMEIAGEALEGLPERMSKAWAVEVMREIFNSFGLDFKRAQYDEVATPRISMIEHSIIEEYEQESEAEDEDEEADEEMESETEEVAPLAGTHKEVRSEASDHAVKPEVDNSTEVDDSADWESVPHTPPDSGDEACCIPSLKRLSRQTQPPTLTPPISPPSTFTKPAIATTDSEKEPDRSITPGHSSRPPSSKRNSLIQTIRTRLSKTSMKLRLTRGIRSVTPDPVLPMSARKNVNLRRAASKASTEDILNVLEGPVLKLNRISDMSLPLTAAERKEMERRRAHESKLTEDFDLVLRLGTLRNPPASPNGQGMESFLSMGEGSSNPTDLFEIPPVPMIEPHYFTSPTSPRSQGTDMRRPTSIGSRSSRPRSKRAITPRRKSGQHTAATLPVRPFVPMRNVLSENNLRLLNAMSSAPPPPPVPSLPSSASYILTSVVRRRKFLPSDGSSINSGNIPVPPIATAARRRSSQRSAQGRQYPSMDYFPMAHTTALGNKGGRVGLVQMGSPRKANKILGDLVLIVPEQDYVQGKRRRRSRRDTGPGMSRRGSFVQTMPIRGSRAKVEKLRGEKLPVQTFGDRTDYPRGNGDMGVETSKPIVETKYMGVESYMDRRPSADRRPSTQSLDHRPTMDGRTSVDGRHLESRASIDRRANLESKANIDRRPNLESRASIDRPRNVESRTDLEPKAPLESRPSIDRRTTVETIEPRANVDSRASFDRTMRNIESRASIDRLRNVESRADLERKTTVESRASVDRKRNVESRSSTKREIQVESRASIDRRTTVETIEPRTNVSSRASSEYMRNLELNRPKSNGAVWII